MIIERFVAKTMRIDSVRTTDASTNLSVSKES